MTRAERLAAWWPTATVPATRVVPGVGSLTWFETRRRQHVRAMPFRHPTLVLVHAGCKQVSRAGELLNVVPGQMLAVPAGLTLDLGNVPGEEGAYRALVLTLAPELIQRLALAYPELIRELLRHPSRLQLHGPVPAGLEATLLRLQGAASPHLAAHEGLAILLLVAQAGFGHLLLGRERSLADRVHDLIELQPDAAWTAAVLAAQLAVSVATLHRQLRASGTSVTAILQEVRLTHGLQQILNTTRPVADIAVACGYASASRFSARFRQRFGCSPTDLR